MEESREYRARNSVTVIAANGTKDDASMGHIRFVPCPSEQDDRLSGCCTIQGILNRHHSLSHRAFDIINPAEIVGLKSEQASILLHSGSPPAGKRVLVARE